MGGGGGHLFIFVEQNAIFSNNGQVNLEFFLNYLTAVEFQKASSA
jgi:hypothetical protein